MADDYRIVVIDDERIPAFPPAEDGFVFFVYGSLHDGTEGLEYFHRHNLSIEELWLDHDLGVREDSVDPYETIMPIVNWLEELGHNGTPFNVGTIFIHTSNPPAGEQMRMALEPYYDVKRANLPVKDN